MAIGLGTGPDRAVWSALANTTTTASATLVGDTPGTTGYGGNVTVGRPNVVGVVGADIRAIRALGADVISSVFVAAVSSGTLSSATCCVCAEVSGSASGVAASSAGALDAFSLTSVSAAFSVSAAASVVEPVGAVAVSGLLAGVGSMVDAAAACVVGVVVEEVADGGVSFETVVPEPPEALTDDVGPSPVVVVV
jgi:hypothetical protein